MTVRELIGLLSEEDPERLVVLAKDAEGNAHSPLSGCWSGAFRARTTYSGEVGLESLGEEDVRHGYGEGDVLRGGVPALVLTPVN